MSKYINANELHNQGWIATRYKSWEPTPLNDSSRLELEVKPLITFYAADVQEVRHGRMVIEPDATVMHCNVCGWAYQYYAGMEEEWNYCPHCGAKMDEAQVR